MADDDSSSRPADDPRSGHEPALERLLLSRIFDAERDGEGWYFFSEVGPTDMITLERAQLEAALAASPMAGSNVASSIVREHLAKRAAGEPPSHDVELDLTTTSWEFIIQDIVRRSPTLECVSAVSSFACSRMRATVLAARSL
ncbi:MULTISPECIES: hypothetical protein [Bradyrhizobium]|uniref:hypothetical protein n=1 Tax=Bradyrhizobium pachyrhizi TaxID=280333 RepID=UPI002AA5AE16